MNPAQHQSGPAAAHVLILDDDPVYTRILAHQLKQHGFECTICHKDKELLVRLKKGLNPDVFILDYHLGAKEASGLDLCRKLRAYVNKPVIMLSANDSLETKVSCLNAGADQYIVKPCNIAELLARIGVVLRNSPARVHPSDRPPTTLQLDDELTLEWETGKMSGPTGAHMQLTDKEAALLEVLVQHRQSPVSRYEAFQSIYGFDMSPDNRSIDILVSRLRKKIESVNRSIHIKTLRGQGYRLCL
jgi:two-component system, OmpR family, response regulator